MRDFFIFRLGRGMWGLSTYVLVWLWSIAVVVLAPVTLLFGWETRVKLTK